jgi:apolipoprotein N-acyltransferase
MRFKDQIFWTASVGGGLFSAGIFLWLGSQAAGVAAESWAVTASWALVVLGAYLLLGAVFRASNKHAQLKRQKAGRVYRRTTWGAVNRWYYWVDRNGKDRDA